MYINPNKFSKIFREYTEKVNQNQAERIPYGSWQVLHRLDIDWPKEAGSSDIYWDSLISPDTLTKISVSYIYGTDTRVEIEIPTDFYKKLIINSHLTPSSLIPDSCCTASSYYADTCGTTTTTNDLIQQILSSIPSTSSELTNGTVVYNPETGSLSYAYDGQLNKVPAGIYFSTPETNNKEKENDTMNIPTMKFDFGPANPEAVSMSPYGLAVRCGDSWYAYNVSEGQTIDVTGLTFSFKNAIYKMPVAVSQIKEGDLIIHQKKAMYVVQVNDKTSIEVIDLAASEQKTVIPVSNMFGFNYVTKVAPLFNLGNVTPSAENPFGNILPMMMMSSMFEDDKDNKSEGNDFMQMMLMMSLMNGTNPFNAMFAGAGPQAE